MRLGAHRIIGRQWLEMDRTGGSDRSTPERRFSDVRLTSRGELLARLRAEDKLELAEDLHVCYGPTIHRIALKPDGSDELK